MNNKIVKLVASALAINAFKILKEIVINITSKKPSFNLEAKFAKIN
jgi:hypothetical protein